MIDIDAKIAAVEAEGFKVFILSRRSEDGLWQCTLHLKDYGPMWHCTYVMELDKVLDYTLEQAQAKLQREGYPKRIEVKTKAKKGDAIAINNILEELDLCPKSQTNLS